MASVASRRVFFSYRSAFTLVSFVLYARVVRPLRSPSPVSRESGFATLRGDVCLPVNTQGKNFQTTLSCNKGDADNKHDDFRNTSLGDLSEVMSSTADSFCLPQNGLYSFCAQKGRFLKADSFCKIALSTLVVASS